MTITEQPKASKVVKPFTVMLDGDEVANYARIKDARHRANKLFEEKPDSTVEVFNTETNVRKIAFLPKDHPVKDEKVNEFGVSSTVLWVAGQKLQKFEITQDQYSLVCQNKITLDEAIAQIERGAVDAPRKVATANSSKKAKSATKSQPEKKDKPQPPTWEVTTLAEDGEVKEVIYPAITSKELLIATKVEKDTGKSRKLLADEHQAPVRMTHSKSGKIYTSKPSK